MEIENRVSMNKDMSMLTGSEILESLRKPKLHRRPNRPKSAHYKMFASRPKSAHPGGRNSRAKQEVSKVKIESKNETIINGAADDQNISKTRQDRPQTARPPTRMSQRYEEIFLDDDDIDVDPVEYFNRPVSRMEGNILEQEVDDVRENLRNVTHGNFLRDDEEYYMNMDPVEYFADPNIRDIVAVVDLEDNNQNKILRESENNRKLSDTDTNASHILSKNASALQVVTDTTTREDVIQNNRITRIADRNIGNIKTDMKGFNYQIKEQNCFGVKQEKLLKNRTSIRATNQFTNSYGNIQNNSKYKGYSGVLKTRPTSLIEQTTNPPFCNEMNYFAGVHGGNKGRDRLKSDSVTLQNGNKIRPYSEDRKLILPEKKMLEFHSTPAERVLAKYKGLSIDERKATRFKSNKESEDQVKKMASKHGLMSNNRVMPPPRKLKPLLFNFEHVKF